MRVPLFLAAVLADEGAIFVELSIPALPVVHQAVVTLVAADRPIGRCPTPLERLVVLHVTKGDRENTELERKRLWRGGFAAVVKNLEDRLANH